MLTLSAIKADVGSVGGHTRPSLSMMEEARARLVQAAERGAITDFDVTHTGDDICLLMVHKHGAGRPRNPQPGLEGIRSGHRYRPETGALWRGPGSTEGCSLRERPRGRTRGGRDRF